MNDISIDLETLSTRQDAAILSIGAVEFDRNTGAIGRRFYVEVNIDSAVKNGHVSGSTLAWWAAQSEAAKRLFGAHQVKETLTVALISLSAFISETASTAGDVRVWGNGATFDISILEHAYQSCSAEAPWKFWNIRDMRTIVDAGAAIGFDKASVPFQGVAHNALDDAEHQARVIAGAWQALTAPARANLLAA